MVDVLSRVPSEISHAKRPVSLYISGMLLLGLSAIPELYFIPGVIGSVLLVASFYYWMRPISVWTALAWLIAVRVIVGILGITNALLGSVLVNTFWIIPFTFPFAESLASLITVPIYILILAYAAYLAAYVLTTKTLIFRWNSSVYEVVLTVAILVWAVSTFMVEYSLDLLRPVLAPSVILAAWAVAGAILQTLMLLSALAAFRRDASIQETVSDV